MNCIYCGALLDDTTSPEHIIPNALGGRLKPRTIVCSEDNNRLGNELDRELCEALEPVRYLLRIRSGEGADPPTLRGVAYGEVKVDLGPDRTLFSKVSPKVTAASDGTYSIIVDGARTIEQGALMAAQMLKKVGIRTRSEAERRFGTQRLVSEKAPLAEPVRLSLTMGGPKQLRTVAKMAFGFLAHAVPGIADATAFDPVRAFIGANSGDGSVRWAPDLPAPPLPFAPNDLGAFPHSIVVWATKGGPVASFVVLFGHLQFLIVLADSWTGQPFAIAHAVDPVAGRSLGTAPLGRVPPPADFAVRDPSYFAPGARQQWAIDFINACVDEQGRQHTAELADRALDPIFARIPDGTDLTDSHIEEISSAVAEAYEDWRFGEATPIDPEAFKALVLSHFD